MEDLVLATMRMKTEVPKKIHTRTSGFRYHQREEDLLLFHHQHQHQQEREEDLLLFHLP